MSHSSRVGGRRGGESAAARPLDGKLSAAEMVVVVAEQLMGLGAGEYELRNHAGNGFCWGSATVPMPSPSLQSRKKAVSQVTG